MARWVAVTWLAVVVATPVVAQEPDACNYADCGLLRVGSDIFAGEGREQVAAFGFLSPPHLRDLFQASDSALFHLDIADAHYRSGQLLGLVGLVVGVAGVITYGVSDEAGSSPSTGEWVGFGLGLSGLALTTWGDHRANRARRAVDEAIWWYNGTLVGSR